MNEKSHGAPLPALAVAALLGACAVPQARDPAPEQHASRPDAATARADAERATVADPAAITDDTTDPEVWGKEYPLQYETYLRTVDQRRTRHGGSEAVPQTPTDADPRTQVAQQRLEHDPRLRTMWLGYAFSVDFREDRGHAYMLEDQTFTGRQAFVQQPGACMQCHASAYVPMKRLGDGDLEAGFRKMNAMRWQEARTLVTHPVACIDCHDPETMALRITRPAFVAGIRALKATEGVRGYDVHTQATPQEMRTFVCAQCHVEYYFRGPERELVFPWAKGVRVEQMMDYYDEIRFKDWVHQTTGAPALKVQHPEFEMYRQGIHWRAGVSCADCHMPEIELKGERITDHQVNSPLLKIESACTKCHAETKPDELRARAELMQDRFFALRDTAMDTLMALIADLEKMQAGVSPRQLEAARYLQRRSQFYVDYTEAENSTGFHASQEALRILGEAIDYARQGQLALRDAAFRPTLPIVSIPVDSPGPQQALPGTAQDAAQPRQEPQRIPQRTRPAR
jgi:nitrite reductase (cytochrome c-552)